MDPGLKQFHEIVNYQLERALWALACPGAMAHSTHRPAPRLHRTEVRQDDQTTALRPLTALGKLRGVLRLRCPACWQGAMFLHPLKMNDHCPHCRYQFDKGNGYFVGAMYSSYTLSLGISVVVAALLWWLGWSTWTIVAASSAAVLLAGPLLVFPYSRVLWVWVEREGWLHDGTEDNATLRRNYLAQRGGEMQRDKKP